MTANGNVSMAALNFVMGATGAEVGVAGQAVVVSVVGAEGTALFLEVADLDPGAVASVEGDVRPPMQLVVEAFQQLSGPDGKVASKISPGSL